jgi:hypothetical protein
MNARNACLLGLVLVVSCRAADDPAALRQPFTDAFDRAELGPDWKDTGGGWSVQGGALAGRDAFNHPVWLQKVLPRNVKVELDIWTPSPDGDLKVECFGDGRTFDPDKGSYTASGYVFIFGGWKNTQSKIARKDEHRSNDPHREDIRVVPDQKYHWEIVRQNGKITWSIDGRPFLVMDDIDPLVGLGQDHFGVGNWQTPVFVDNVVITPL